MKKTQKGFTLVELVVVIAIIGVLAAILVPSMLNYVKKSRLKTANSNAKTAYNAVAELLADAETQGYARDKVITADAPAANNTAGNFKYTIKGGSVYDAKTAAKQASGDEGAKKIAAVLVENGDEAGCFKVIKQSINGENSFVVFWAKTTSDEMVGEYPDAIQWDGWKKNGKGMTIGSATYRYDNK